MIVSRFVADIHFLWPSNIWIIVWTRRQGHHIAIFTFVLSHSSMQFMLRVTVWDWVSFGLLSLGCLALRWLQRTSNILSFSSSISIFLFPRFQFIWGHRKRERCLQKLTRGKTWQTERRPDLGHNNSVSQNYLRLFLLQATLSSCAYLL